MTNHDLWPAPTSGPVTARVSVPGSKSLTNRYLVLAALSDGPVRIGHPLVARDTTLMADALEALGIGVERGADEWTITPAPMHSAEIFTGLAGNVMRFVPPASALADGDVSFDGDPAARVRPMGAIVTGLRGLGIEVDAAELDSKPVLPIVVHGTGRIAGGTLEVDASASSQFISGLLLTAPRMDAGLDLRHVGNSVPSTPHIAMTVECLRRGGVDVTAIGEPATRWVVQPGPIHLDHVAIEPDLSNAGPFLAAAMVTGGEVTIERWPLHTTQPGDSYREIFAAMGADVELGEEQEGGVADLTLRGPSEIAPIDMDLGDVGELVPTIAAVAAFATGESHLCNIEHLRGHETDRLTALATELRRLGAGASEEHDSLTIQPADAGRAMHGADLESYEDHRMATFGAIIGLRVDGVRVVNIATTSKTLPDFPGMWEDMLG